MPVEGEGRADAVLIQGPIERAVVGAAAGAAVEDAAIVEREVVEIVRIEVALARAAQVVGFDEEPAVAEPEVRRAAVALHRGRGPRDEIDFDLGIAAAETLASAKVPPVPRSIASQPVPGPARPSLNSKMIRAPPRIVRSAPLSGMPSSMVSLPTLLPWLSTAPLWISTRLIVPVPCKVALTPTLTLPATVPSARNRAEPEPPPTLKLPAAEPVPATLKVPPVIVPPPADRAAGLHVDRAGRLREQAAADRAVVLHVDRAAGDGQIAGDRAAVDRKRTAADGRVAAERAAVGDRRRAAVDVRLARLRAVDVLRAAAVDRHLAAEAPVKSPSLTKTWPPSAELTESVPPATVVTPAKPELLPLR